MLLLPVAVASESLYGFRTTKKASAGDYGFPVLQVFHTIIFIRGKDCTCFSFEILKVFLWKCIQKSLGTSWSLAYPCSYPPCSILGSKKKHIEPIHHTLGPYFLRTKSAHPWVLGARSVVSPKSWACDVFDASRKDVLDASRTLQSKLKQKKQKRSNLRQEPSLRVYSDYSHHPFVHLYQVIAPGCKADRQCLVEVEVKSIFHTHRILLSLQLMLQSITFILCHFDSATFFGHPWDP